MKARPSQAMLYSILLLLFLVLPAVLGVHNLVNNPKFDEGSTGQDGKGIVKSKYRHSPVPFTPSKKAIFCNHQATDAANLFPTVVITIVAKIQLAIGQHGRSPKLHSHHE